jgi:hypothetical protein
VNNEELVKSLRTEIQTYLKNTVADLQQEISGMQDRMTAEIERHRGELEKSFQALLAKGSEANVDDNFAGIVAEHLKIAYEDGSQETEAKYANQQPQTAPADYSTLRDAINEISQQGSQADILKSLVKYASNYASRGAFFIVKSDHLVGWRVFGAEAKIGDEAVREIFLSIDNNTMLGTSVKQNATQRTLQGGNNNDRQYLSRLNFGEPRQMIAVPLVVRERGVAVLYADSGEGSAPIQVEALETLVRVAGLTVELLANVKPPSAKPKAQTTPLKPVTESPVKDFSYSSMTAAQPKVETAFEYQPAPATTAKTGSYEVAFEPPPVVKPVVEQEFTPTARLNDLQPSPYDVVVEAQPANDFQQFAPPAKPPEEAFSFDPAPSYTAPAPVETAPPPTPAMPEISFEPVVAQPQPEVQAAPQRANTRGLELPVEVPEEERRQHNDARRFARLLVSEIKLYNEQKVKEGRQAGDLYTRLREAVDRSRDMYEKRVAPPVNTKFDYFHYELVTTLAEGDPDKLGKDYPGAAV